MNKKFYITTSIAYVNAPPHIGFAQELIQADVIARYHRLSGEDVFFLTGTDDHGIKVVRTARENGKTPKEFTDEISEKFISLKQALNLSNDYFIRTSDQAKHWPTVKKIWLQLKENGDLYKKKYKGFYCVGCESFIKENDLVLGKCLIHQKEPEIIEEENYFFRLSKYEEQLKEIIEKEQIKIIPGSKKKELLSFFNQGLEDISCSRSREKLEWGIPVPNDEGQTIYVWFEALLNYLSAVDYFLNNDKFQRFWPPDVQCIGKDVFTRFHGSLWPAMILSLGLTLPKSIFIHGFINVDGQKMSKSLGNVIDPFELVKKYGVDATRYFFLREIPATEDGDFTYKKFEERYNSDLAKGLGNLVARIITLAEKVIIRDNSPFAFESQIKKCWQDYLIALNDLKFNEALSSIWDLMSFCDKYIEREKPWEKDFEDQSTINNLLFVLSNIASFLRPFLPETSEKIFLQLGINPDSQEPWKFKIKKGESLFPRI